MKALLLLALLLSVNTVNAICKVQSLQGGRTVEEKPLIYGNEVHDERAIYFMAAQLNSGESIKVIYQPSWKENGYGNTGAIADVYVQNASGIQRVMNAYGDGVSLEQAMNGASYKNENGRLKVLCK